MKKYSERWETLYIIVGNGLAVVTFYFYNGRLHPFSKILEDSDTKGKRRKTKELFDKTLHDNFFFRNGKNHNHQGWKWTSTDLSIPMWNFMPTRSPHWGGQVCTLLQTFSFQFFSISRRLALAWAGNEISIVNLT